MSKIKYENEIANHRRDGYLLLIGYVIIEIYREYEEIYFLDEFYVWNNEKNGSIYSWFDKGKNDAVLEYSGEAQVKLGCLVAISNRGKCYYNIIRKAYDQFLFSDFIVDLFDQVENHSIT